MGLFDLFAGPDINVGVQEWKASKGAVLLDVRSADEHGQGHIPGSVNVPLNRINQVLELYPDKGTQLFVHCLSGVRSNQAVSFLKRSGYGSVKNIGGISGYTGKVVRWL